MHEKLGHLDLNGLKMMLKSNAKGLKNVKYVIKVLISNHSNYKGEFYKGPVLKLRDNTIIIHINLI